MSKLSKLLLGSSIFLMAFGAFTIWAVLYSPNVKQDIAGLPYFIPTGTEYETLQSSMATEVVKNSLTFSLASKVMRFSQSSVKPGRYLFDAASTNMDIIRRVRSGNQSPTTVTINNLRDLEGLCARITENIEIDSLSFCQFLYEYLKDNDIVEEEGLTIFTPNTYQVYWNISAEDLLARMQKESNIFWRKPQRIERMKSLGLGPKEVYTLASIVEKESNFIPERAAIAGVYLNRLERGIPLQADPTVVFANRIFGTGRVLYEHLEYDSPYNTYMYPGLPPGPICMPSMTSIDAVLNREVHDYIYFCADPSLNGQHVFAKTLRQHNRNAEAYRKAVYN